MRQCHATSQTEMEINITEQVAHQYQLITVVLKLMKHHQSINTSPQPGTINAHHARSNRRMAANTATPEMVRRWKTE